MAPQDPQPTIAIERRIDTILVSPLLFEIRPILARLTGARTIELAARSSRRSRFWTGELGGCRVLVGTAGAEGADHGRGAVRLAHRLAESSPEAPLLIVGTAGALDPKLEAGTALWPVRFLDERPDARRFRLELATTKGPVGSGSDGSSSTTVVTVARPVVTAEERRRLHGLEGHPIAVDMESAPMVGECRELGRACHVLRVVSDEAHRELPAYLQRCVASDGRLERGRIVRELLLRPWTLPALLGLARSAAAAAESAAASVERWLSAGEGRMGG